MLMNLYNQHFHDHHHHPSSTVCPTISIGCLRHMILSSSARVVVEADVAMKLVKIGIDWCKNWELIASTKKLV